MILTIPYEYEQSYLPTKRHRNPRFMRVKDEMQIEIEEPKAEDFPVAFIVHEYQHRHPNMKTYEDYHESDGKFELYAEEIRTDRKRLYKKRYVRHGAAIGAPVTDPQSIVQNCMPRWSPLPLHPSDFTEKSVKIENNKRQIRTDRRNSAKNLKYFDGCFWEVCEEPRYVVQTFGLGHNHGGTSLFITEYYNSNIGKDRYFNAMQRAEAIAYGKNVAMRRGDTKDVDRIGQREWIDVMMPEMVNVNPNRQHGNGDAFQNDMENLIEHSDGAFEAGLLCMLRAMR